MTPLATSETCGVIELASNRLITLVDVDVGTFQPRVDAEK